MAPYSYDISNPVDQPIDLIARKSLHNSITSDIFDGNVGFSHPGNIMMNMGTLAELKSQIDKYM